ncbi:hypothetical protein N7478_000799 [Penicillium angulare]|uniref:uncharacterized protein n=1 Tax=Penicillium angulare TaxID=116970 RepID=UPI00254002FB|nr:uncharacterized protein N7478_000799 [Penicillium angulare]KAJ5291548.1 hypothetical protein N7478_000799 [Penicillium angulare]
MKADLLNIINIQTAHDSEKQDLLAGEPSVISPAHLTDDGRTAMQTTNMTVREPNPQIDGKLTKKERRVIYRRLLKIMNQLDDEFTQAIEERDARIHEHQKVIQRLRDDVPIRKLKLRHAIAKKEKSCAVKLILEAEVHKRKLLLK